MKLILDKNVAEIHKDGKLVIRLTGPCGCILGAHIPDLDVINVVKIEGVTACVEGDNFVAIDVKQDGGDCKTTCCE